MVLGYIGCSVYMKLVEQERVDKKNEELFNIYKENEASIGQLIKRQQEILNRLYNIEAKRQQEISAKKKKWWRRS
jgi:hypothetical protein